MPSDEEIRIYGQNTRGLKREAKLEELVEQGFKREAFAIALQEKWRVGKLSLDSRGWLFIHSGQEERSCARGSGGVALLLSPKARRAWDEAGAKVLYFGVRSVAVRLQIKIKDGGRGRGQVLSVLTVPCVGC